MTTTSAPVDAEASQGDDDALSDYGDDDGMQWYASAAAGPEDAPEATVADEEREESQAEREADGEATSAQDPYMLVESDPYQLFEAETSPIQEAASAEAEKPARPLPKPSAAPGHRPSKIQKIEKEKTTAEGETGEAPAFPEFMSLGAPKPKAKLPFAEDLPLKKLAKVLQVPPAPEATKPWTPSWLAEESAAQVDPMSYATEMVPEPGLQDLGAEVLSWDERCVVVKQGQVHIELQRRKPAMDNLALLRFCDWLDEQMPLVVQHFPYVKKSGAYVDLSDNEIGTNGLDKLFQVLRDHRVPCVVLKAYRNSIDDSFVDTLVEYLYTQPEAFPMHGIHISHNDISDKGAFRLIRAAAQCGHYPRLTTRLPLWLRLEVNSLENPRKVIQDANDEGFCVCLMQDGLCSRDNCDHYSGVHVQLPYFLNQPAKGQANVEQFGYSKQRSGGSYSSTQGVLAPQAGYGERNGITGVSKKAAPPPRASFERGYEWQYHETWGWGYGKSQGWNGKGGGKWPGKGNRMWQGKALIAKAKKDMKLAEGQADLGFQWRYIGEGRPPRVTSVTGPLVAQTAKAGDCLLRVNGLDMAMMTEKQVTDLLRQRPLELRFGDE